MSLNSKRRFQLKNAYFNFLKDTAKIVDPYVRDVVSENYGEVSDLERVLLERYRIGKPQLRPGLVRAGFELVEGDK